MEMYTVQSGETLYTIALRHGTTVEAIMEANNLSDRALVFPGQRLLIPFGYLARTPVPTPSRKYSSVLQIDGALKPPLWPLSNFSSIRPCRQCITKRSG